MSSKRNLDNVYDQIDKSQLWSEPRITELDLMKQSFNEQSKYYKQHVDTRTPNETQLERIQDNLLQHDTNEPILEQFTIHKHDMSKYNIDEQKIHKLRDYYHKFKQKVIQYHTILNNKVEKVKETNNQIQSFPILQNVKSNTDTKGMYINKFGYGQPFLSETRHTTCNDSFNTINSSEYQKINKGSSLGENSPCGFEGRNIVSNNIYAWVDQKGNKHLYQSKDIYDKSLCKKLVGNAVEISEQEFNSIPTHNTTITTTSFSCNPYVYSDNIQHSTTIEKEIFELYMNIVNIVQQLTGKTTKYRDELKNIKKHVDDDLKTIKEKNYTSQHVNTLTHNISDTERLYDKEYYTYLGWLFITLTIGGITIHRFIK